jgi:cobalamin biosynthesis protein CbiG
LAFPDAEIVLIDGDRRFVLGMGCERGALVDDALALAIETLAQAGLSSSDLAGLASIDSKFDEPAILAVSAYLGVPLRLFSAVTLEAETPRLKNPSERVFRLLGCHGVAEAAALAAAGASASLTVPKRKSSSATAAIAEIR